MLKRRTIYTIYCESDEPVVVVNKQDLTVVKRLMVGIANAGS